MKGKLITPKIYLNLPSKPGVYIFINPAGKPIYVGKSKSLKNRVSSYFALHLEPKTRQMVSNAKFLKYITTNSEFEAILLEANLIQKLQPKYNIELKDNKSPLYIVITNDSIPIIKTARQRDLKLIRSKKTFGPYADGSTAKAVLRNIRKSIPYGDHKPTKRKCIRAHIGLCNPCPSQVAANPKLKNVYLKNISQTTKILSGKISSAKKDIEKEIKFLSKQDRFEEARDLLKKLQNLQYISSPKELPGSYIENPNFSQDIHRRELNELEKLIDLKNLKRIECYDIAHLAGTNPTASMVTFISGEPEKSLYRHFKIRKQNFNNDTEAMKIIFKRRSKHFNPALREGRGWGTPDLIIVDGGKGQVGAAQEVVKNIPIIGLAKGTKNLVIKKNNKFIIIPLKKSPARNLIERLDNEAHRFARRYHHLLVKKALLKN